MSEPSEPGPSEPVAVEMRGPGDGGAAATSGDTEEFDALPVLAEGATVVRPYRLPAAPTTYWRSTAASIPAAQAVAVAAAGGFVAGAAVVGLVSRRQRQVPARQRARRVPRRAGRAFAGRSAFAGKSASKAGELVQIVGSRSLLVDVHLLAGRD